MAGIIKLAQYDCGNGLNTLQAVQTANQRRVTLLNNRAFDNRLVKTDTWRGETEVYPAWTGTAIVTRKAGEKLGAAIEYKDAGITYVFEVPAHLQGEKDIALAVEHGFASEGKPIIAFREDGQNRFVLDVSDKTQIGTIQAFPKSDGWHLPEARFGIPTGDSISSGNSDARYLSRTGNYVGLLARGFYGGWRYVDAHRLPSSRFGVLGTSTGAQAPAATQNGASIAVEGTKDLNSLKAEATAAVAQINDQAIAQPIKKFITAQEEMQKLVSMGALELVPTLLASSMLNIAEGAASAVAKITDEAIARPIKEFMASAITNQ